MLRRFTIGQRIIFIVILMTVFIAGVTLAFLQNSMTLEKTAVSEVQGKMLDGHKARLKLAVDSMAISLGKALEGFERAEQDAILRKAITPIIFEEDKSGYYFVFRGTITVAHPKASLIDKDLKDLKDANGIKMIAELDKAAKAGGGFVEYIWPKGDSGDQPKLSYAQMIPGTDVSIGTGVYIDNVQAEAAKVSSSFHKLIVQNLVLIVGSLAALFVLGLVPACWLIIRSITTPIKTATDAAGRIAKGDLEVELDAQGSDEAAHLENALNSMAQTLKQNIKEITAKTAEAEEKALAAEHAMHEAEEAKALAETAKCDGMMHAAQRLEGIIAELLEAAQDIESQSAEIRHGTEIQRERVHSTATAMEEMNATVLEVARNSSHAAEVGQLAKESASEGAQVVSETVAAMDKTQRQAEQLRENMVQLGEQANAIGNIMGVITDIADQTNLLALNAAIEAARAGEAGRGFAVVADEVRKLAEKTMVATKEVGDSITAIQSVASDNIASMQQAVGGLEHSTELTNKSGEVLQRIVEASEQSADQIQSIATAAEQQSSASEEINIAIDEINRIASDTAQSVEQSTASLERLAEQARLLEEVIEALKEEGQL
ncbi:methyl-accepting chemotaxis protein [Salidesulfovibrio onnuriiensis]|uniref:methyl-accepting chemotaxis protein n=1 Tax=Salidesulfovibrio onnuriiensis TaxID=2583823 RepID=UPI00165011A6|nr:methyl-accepting chemotaxis protein [Salidesulfovibrio onnuriiensis]